MELNDLALIVLNYNSYDLVIKCVEQLRKFKLSFHIIIVDNDSPDKSYAQLVEDYDKTEVDVISTGSNRGYSAGNNFGIYYAIEKYNINYFAVLNPDVIIPSETVITDLLKTIHNYPNCAVIGASVIDIDGYYTSSNSAWNIPSMWEFILSKSIFYSNKKKIQNRWKMINENTVKVDCIVGCFFIAKVEAFEKIGFLDEDIFMYNEEILLGYKLKQKGYIELLKLDHFYYHNHQKKEAPKISNYLIRRKKRFLSDVVLFKKIYPKEGLLLLYIIEGINRVVLFPWFIIRPLIRREK